VFGLDAADSNEASYEQHPVEVLESPDSPGFLAGLLKDAVCRWRGDVPRTMAEMKAAFYLIIDEALRDSEPEPKSETLEAVAELLQRFANQPHGQLYAHAYLLVLNRCPYSESEIARRLNVTKAAVSKIKRRIEDQLELKSRVGRSEESCEKFRQLRIGKRKQPIPFLARPLFAQAI
jgi:hypothetical protein